MFFFALRFWLITGEKKSSNCPFRLTLKLIIMLVEEREDKKKEI